MIERQKGVIARFGFGVEGTVLCASSEERSSLNKQASIPFIHSLMKPSQHSFLALEK